MDLLHHGFLAFAHSGYQRPFYPIDPQRPSLSPPAELHLEVSTTSFCALACLKGHVSSPLAMAPMQRLPREWCHALVVQEDVAQGEPWETEMDRDKVIRLSAGASGSTSRPSTAAAGTGTYDTDTDADFGLLESYSKGARKKRSRTQRMTLSVARLRLICVCSSSKGRD